MNYRLGERSLTVTHLKAIERVYAAGGKRMLELLRLSPAHFIPRVLKHLKDKDTEWCEMREGLTAEWSRTMRKNYLKSLDFRSPDFKRQDRKQLASRRCSAMHTSRPARTGSSTPRGGWMR